MTIRVINYNNNMRYESQDSKLKTVISYTTINHIRLITDALYHFTLSDL